MFLIHIIREIRAIRGSKIWPATRNPLPRVAPHAALPAGQPLLLVARGRGILHAAREDFGRGFRKLLRGAGTAAMHFLQDLEQAPALAFVALGLEQAVAFEV